jgi:glycosyltransferase involved in cell wall biosynthesis
MKEAAESTKRVVIVSSTSLAFNPRVLKEAAALAASHFEVVVIGCGFDKDSMQIDLELAQSHGFTFQPVELIKSSQAWNLFYSLIRRVRSKLPSLLYQITGIESRFQLGGFLDDLLRCATALDAHFYIVHLEPALWVGEQLGKAGFLVGVDIEDWYSEDLPPQARRKRPIRLLRYLEQSVLSMASHATCTSLAMGAALSKEYKCRPPTVIYNAFPWADRKTLDGKIKNRKDLSIPSIHWYSQTLGAGRGLEDLFAALPQVKRPMEVHLRGHLPVGGEKWLHAVVPENWRKRVFVHPLVSNNELLSRIAEHDIGFAGEQKYCRSRDLTVTNKILHYLLGGLAAVASDTAGQCEIAAQADGAVHLYPAGDSTALAEQLNKLLGSPEALQFAKTAALRVAEKTFSWEQMTSRLLTSVNQVFDLNQKQTK